jgi:hypothetical protein
LPPEVPLALVEQALVNNLDIGTYRRAVTSEAEQRNQRHLQRHNQQADDDHHQQRAAGEAHPGQCIGREGRDHDRDDRRRNRHGQRVDEGSADVLGGKHGLIVVDSEARRADQRKIDARRHLESELNGRRPQVVAIGLHRDLATVVHRHGAAGSILVHVGVGGAKATDLAAVGACLAEQVAPDDPGIAFLDLGGGLREANGGQPRRRRQRRPPAGDRELVLVAQRRHQQADRRKGPQQDKEE